MRTTLDKTPCTPDGWGSVAWSGAKVARPEAAPARPQKGRCSLDAHHPEMRELNGGKRLPAGLAFPAAFMVPCEQAAAAETNPLHSY